MWWEALKANNVPRKLWLLRAGHTDPFESRRAEWVKTLHRWFDHYLYAVNNGIETEPKVTIEEGITETADADRWKNYDEWPIPGTQNVDVFLRATDVATAAGTLGGGAGGGAADTLGFTARTNTNETTLMNTPTGAQTNRRVFLSRHADQGRAPVRHGHGRTSPPRSARRRATSASSSPTTARPRSSRSPAAARASPTPRPAPAGATPATTRSPAKRARPATSATRAPPRSREIDTACYLEVSKPHTSVTAVARHARHPRLVEPRFAVVPRRHAGHDRPAVPLQVPDHADRAHLQGRPPDRDHHRRLEHEHDVGHRQRQRRGHARHPHLAR